MSRVASVALDRTRAALIALFSLGTLAALLLALAGCGDDGGAAAGLAAQADSTDGVPRPTPTAVPAPNEIRLAPVPGEVLRIQASLHLAGDSLVAGVQNDLTFDPSLPIAARPNGRPDCAFDPATGKNASAFGFQPPGCIPGEDCAAVRAVVLSFGDTDPIPDGSVLYTCNLAPAADAEAGRAYPLRCSFALGSTPDGLPVAVDCPDVEVGAP